MKKYSNLFLRYILQVNQDNLGVLNYTKFLKKKYSKRPVLSFCLLVLPQKVMSECFVLFCNQEIH